MNSSFQELCVLRPCDRNNKGFLINKKSIFFMTKIGEWSTGFPSCSWPIVCRPSWNVRCKKRDGNKYYHWKEIVIFPFEFYPELFFLCTAYKTTIFTLVFVRNCLCKCWNVIWMSILNRPHKIALGRGGAAFKTWVIINLYRGPWNNRQLGLGVPQKPSALLELTALEN